MKLAKQGSVEMMVGEIEDFVHAVIVYLDFSQVRKISLEVVEFVAVRIVQRETLHERGASGAVQRFLRP